MVGGHVSFCGTLFVKANQQEIKFGKRLLMMQRLLYLIGLFIPPVSIQTKRPKEVMSLITTSRLDPYAARFWLM